MRFHCFAHENRLNLNSSYSHAFSDEAHARVRVVATTNAIDSYGSDIVLRDGSMCFRSSVLTILKTVAQENSKQFLNMPEDESARILSQIRDPNLKLALAFGAYVAQFASLLCTGFSSVSVLCGCFNAALVGIGLHHAGLQDTDRKIVESLFCSQKIMVLIATATLAWGVNFPAHLVVVKGTEYYDGLLFKSFSLFIAR